MEREEKSVFTFDDIAKQKEKNLPLDIRKPYSPLDFWETAAEYFAKSYNKRELFIQNVAWLLQKFEILKPESILDAGCGFGRQMPFIVEGLKEKSPEVIYGVDFCQKMLEFSEEYLKESPVKSKIKILMADCRSLPYTDCHFDIVFTDSLFSHLGKSDSQRVANELKRVAKKYIITMERFVFHGEHPEPHVWSWDTNKFFRLKVLETRHIGNGMVGSVLEKK